MFKPGGQAAFDKLLGMFHFFKEINDFTGFFFGKVYIF